MRRKAELIGGPKDGITITVEDSQCVFRVFIRKAPETDAWIDSDAGTRVPMLKDKYGVGLYKRLHLQELTRQSLLLENKFTIDFFWKGETDD